MSWETEEPSRPSELARLQERARRAVDIAHATLLFRRHGVQYGYRPAVQGQFRVDCQGTMAIGDGFLILATLMPTLFEVGPGARLTIGNEVVMNFGVNINARLEITIGDYVLIGPLVSILDDNMHDVVPGDRRRAPVHIGTNVWIARGVSIGPGVTIGDHSVVAANSAVTQDVPAATLVGGVPARVVRELDIPDDWRRR